MVYNNNNYVSYTTKSRISLSFVTACCLESRTWIGKLSILISQIVYRHPVIFVQKKPLSLRFIFVGSLI